MNRIGILCASDTELAPFLECMHAPKATEKAMLKFYEGTIRQAQTAAVFSGVCKVNAAIAAQLLIEEFHAGLVVNAGTAGAIHESVRPFDTVIAERSAYHDVADDILTEFHPRMQSVYFQSDQKLLAIAKDYAPTAKYPILFGTIVTGEQFIAGNERDRISKRFAPLAVDMETASVAHVCYVHKLPFIAVRTITDTASHNGMESFEKNCEAASRISAEIVADLLQRYALL